MEQQSPNTNTFIIPLSIVIAGALIAAAVYFGGGRAAGPAANAAAANQNIELAAVTESDHVLGNRNAPVKIVEYSDIECPFCKVFHATLHQIMTEYEGRVAWVYRHFPIASLHRNATREAEATECAAELGGNQVFWRYIDTVFQRTNSNDSLDLAELPKIAAEVGLNQAAFNECLSSGRHSAKVQASIEDAVKSGGRGTPHSIIVLDSALSSSKENGLKDLILQRGLPPTAIIVSKDKTKVALGGALPLDLMREILTIVLR